MLLQKNFTFHSLSLVKPMKLIPLSLFPLHSQSWNPFLSRETFPPFSIVKLDRSPFSIVHSSQSKNPFLHFHSSILNRKPLSILRTQSNPVTVKLNPTMKFKLKPQTTVTSPPSNTIAVSLCIFTVSNSSSKRYQNSNSSSTNFNTLFFCFDFRFEIVSQQLWHSRWVAVKPCSVVVSAKL